MSVLIEMLRDLDRRGKAPLMQSTLVSAIETVPEPTAGSAKRPGVMRLLQIIGSISLLGAIAWWLLWPRAPGSVNSPFSAALTRSAPAQPLAAPAPAPLPAPAPAPAHAAAPVPAPPRASVNVPAAPSASVVKVPRVATGTNNGASRKLAARPPMAAVAQTAKTPNMELAAASGDAPPKPTQEDASQPPAGTDDVVRFSGNSGHAPADLARAYDLAQRGRDTEAIELLQHSVHDWPQYAESRSALATLLNERGQRKEALAVLLAGAAIDPAHFALTAARLQIELGDPAEALSTLALVPPPQRNADYHATAAAMAQRAGRHELAIEEFHSALASGKPRAIWWVGLGSSLEQIGQKVEALKAYRQAQGQADISSATSEFVRQRIAALSEPASASLDSAQAPPSVAAHP